jgi:hypothetical protein
MDRRHPRRRDQVSDDDLTPEERASWNGYLDGLRDARSAGEDCTDSWGNLYRLDWLDRIEELREHAEEVLANGAPS